MSQPWSDAARSLTERVDALLAEMTRAEKLAQLGSVGVDAELGGGVAPLQEAFSEPATWEEASGHGMGHFTRPHGTRPIDPVEGAQRLGERQRDLVARTRLGIPAIAHEECLTGFTTYGATVFPTPLALAATFDPDAVERMTRAIGERMRAAGVHQGLSPVMDVVRDPRWGRVEETFGEDPYLVGTIGTGYVRGLESCGIVATLKHFAGYSASQAARNHGPVAMGPRTLRDVILVPFEMAIREGGARLGDELLQRDRRDAGGRRRGAADRRAARRMGLRGHGRLRLLVGGLPGDHAPGRRHPGGGRRARADRGDRRRAAARALLRRAARGARRDDRPRGPPRAAPEG